MKKITLFVLVLAITTLSFANKESKIAYTQKSGKVEFFAIGKPSLLKIRGTNEALIGNLNEDLTENGKELSGVFHIPLKDFVTGMKMRDEHLKNKTFEVEQYPEAQLTLNPIPLKEDQLKNGASFSTPFTGKLKLHGVEKDIAGEVKLTREKAEIQHQAAFTIHLSDFNIPAPKFAGMSIQEEVKIEVNGKAIHGTQVQ